jgi:hypothetical protein
MTEEEKLIADLGKPKLGDKHTLRVRIRESKEFKVTSKQRIDRQSIAPSICTECR